MPVTVADGVVPTFPFGLLIRLPPGPRLLVYGRIKVSTVPAGFFQHLWSRAVTQDIQFNTGQEYGSRGPATSAG